MSAECTFSEGCTRPSDKCTLIDSLAGGQATACVERAGDVAAGLPCERHQGGLGHDNCGEELFCSFIGVLPPSAGGTRLCRNLCISHGDCPTGEKCAAIADHGPKAGICGTPCQPFSSCGDGMSCSDAFGDIEGGPLDLIFVCRVPGTVRSGGSCTLHEDCPAEHLCLSSTATSGNERCLPMCDSGHACATGTCVSVGAAGVCVSP